MSWRVHAAAVTGRSHLDAGQPCQDALAHHVVDNVLCAVVCDGAGSAPRSDLGAQTLARRVAQGWAARVVSGVALPALGAEAAREALASVLGEAREALRQHPDAGPGDLSAYAATLVGAVIGPQGGWLVHIGDGVAAARPQAPEAPTIVSSPENGEYCNETYFVTGEQWREHLRLTPVTGPVHAVLLMSDGAAPFVMARGLTDLYRPFFDPVDRYLASVEPGQGSLALVSTLDDPRTHSITADDKTLLFAQWQA